MKLINLPAALKEYFSCFMFEPADEITLQNIQNGLKVYYPNEQLNIDIGTDHIGRLTVSLVFETEADAILFILRNPL